MDQSEAGKIGYEKSKDKLQDYRDRRSKNLREDYAKNPKICPNCDTQLPYKKRHNKFCTQSCAASFNNKGVVRVETTNPEDCAHCGATKETRQNKYCDACIEDNVYSNKKTTLAEAGSDRTRKRILIERREHRCESCGLAEWLDQPIPLELDHIDGNPDNNAEENLRLICPNCHALTETYKGANAGGNSSRQKMRRRRYRQGKTY